MVRGMPEPGQSRDAYEPLSLPTDGIDEAALFKLIDQRQIDKLLDFRQRLLVRVLIFDHEMDDFSDGRGVVCNVGA